MAILPFGHSGYTKINGVNGAGRERIKTPPVPCPQPCDVFLSPDEAQIKRKLDCRFYGGCLDIAIEERWESFHCLQCEAYEAKSKKELLAEDALLTGLIEGAVNPFRK